MAEFTIYNPKAGLTKHNNCIHVGCYAERNELYCNLKSYGEHHYILYWKEDVRLRPMEKTQWFCWECYDWLVYYIHVLECWVQFDSTVIDII